MDLKRESGQTSGDLGRNFKLILVVGNIAEYLIVEKIQNSKTSKPFDRSSVQSPRTRKKFANLSFKIGWIKSDTKFQLELSLTHRYLEKSNFISTFEPNEFLGIFLVLETEPAFFALKFQQFTNFGENLVDFGVIINHELAHLPQSGYSYRDS